MPLNRARCIGDVTFRLLLSFTVMAAYSLGHRYSYCLCWPDDRREGGFLRMSYNGFCGRLEVNIALDPTAFLARTPNLLLPPVVENAILHSIAPKITPRRVDVLAHVKGDRLHLEGARRRHGPAARPRAPASPASASRLHAPCRKKITASATGSRARACPVAASLCPSNFPVFYEPCRKPCSA
jgi:hypothetical protein